MEVLVLNTSYQPLQILIMRKAIKLLAKNRADVIKSIEGKTIKSCYINMPLPSVIKLTQYIKYQRKPLPYSKKNVLIRDKFLCQYCGGKDGLTIDHIVPQCKNGESTFENTIACCKRCNTIKGDKTLKQSGFILSHQPRRPSPFILMRYLKHPEWEEFLYC